MGRGILWGGYGAVGRPYRGWGGAYGVSGASGRGRGLEDPYKEVGVVCEWTLRHAVGVASEGCRCATNVA